MLTFMLCDIMHTRLIFSFFIILFFIDLLNYIFSGYPNEISGRLIILIAFVVWINSVNFTKSMIYRFPFVWATPIGNFLTKTFQTAVYFIATKAAVTTFLVFFYTFGQIVKALTVDLTVMISEFNFFIKTEIGQFSAQSRRQIAQKLCAIIQFHGDDFK